ncbi:hypothetical protein BMI90_07395 [Thioclava sp. L04-15]|uniref:hypothetical protein n=1 Tax=Thioclava sp. L04-15 TaxID=1915318 RepID=UPI000998BB86|nr:hypothetical protein [Thioclava sp. L04-15]OOY28489.1 hypothetical protein BMI90_07395 [Thioclava sp. L04-15]TNE93572.1 MAG: hypothetical protein EP337_02975 [Paracoccaceae bacterium]
MRADHRHYARRITHALCLWLGLVALILAPLVLTQTHAPASALALEVTVQHGHSHAGQTAAPAHDTADHEHQTIAILPEAAGIATPVQISLATNVGLVRPSLPPQALRRPPRQI